MARSYTQRQSPFTPGILMLFGAICIVGTGALDEIRQDRLSSEAEEAREINEADDVDQPFAMVDEGLALIDGHCFDEWLKIDHESALLSDSWECLSRGPPTA